MTFTLNFQICTKMFFLIFYNVFRPIEIRFLGPLKIYQWPEPGLQIELHEGRFEFG